MRTALPATMHAAVLTGFGGPDKLVYRDDVPLPTAQTGEVLIRVGASAVNNTDINTRVGWYSKTVDSATAADSVGFDTNADATPGWRLRGVRRAQPDLDGVTVSAGGVGGGVWPKGCKAARTTSGVNGGLRKRIPVASKIALAMAAVPGTEEDSPAPKGTSSPGRGICTTSMTGTWRKFKIG